jgi:hypothetical protein
MASQRPGKGKPFPAGNHSFKGATIVLGADGAITVRAGDSVSRFAGCLYKDSLVGWEEFGRKNGNQVEKLKDVGQIRLNETIYHIPTWNAKKPIGQSTMDFDGKKLVWKAADGTVLLSLPAVSGLKANNPFIDKLIKSGRTDIKKGVDYTDPKYQDLPMAGPIPEGEYHLTLRPNMPFEKTGGGWGVGAWALNPTTKGGKILHWLDVKFDLDGVRSGFFLHHDGSKSGTSDGTAGCIGVIDRQQVLDLQTQLSDYHKNEKKTLVTVRVKY